MKSNFKLFFLSLCTLFTVVSCVPTTSSEEVTSSSVNTNNSNVDIARAYIKARQVYDIEQIKPLLADNVQIIENGKTSSVEDMASAFRYFEATGLTEEIESCASESENNVNEIRCAVRLRSNVSDVMGYEPVEGSAFEFVISNNKIDSVNLILDLKFWEPKVFWRLLSYIDANHREDRARMFVNGGVVGLSDEVIELWRTYSAEFVKSRSQQ